MVIEFFAAVMAAVGFIDWFRHDHRIQFFINSILYIKHPPGLIRKFFIQLDQCGFCFSHVAVLMVTAAWYYTMYGHNNIVIVTIKFLGLFFALRVSASFVHDIWKKLNPHKSPESINRPRD